MVGHSLFTDPFTVVLYQDTDDLGEYFPVLTGALLALLRRLRESCSPSVADSVDGAVSAVSALRIDV